MKGTHMSNSAKSRDAIGVMFIHVHRVGTLPSITTVTKETFIVRKVFILKNSALYLLTAYDLPFSHAKFQNSGSNGLATIPIWMKKLLGKFKQILIQEIFECWLKFFQLWKNFAKCINKYSWLIWSFLFNLHEFRTVFTWKIAKKWCF